MSTQPFGPTGVEVPVIGQGTWLMERDRRAAIDALREGIDLGLTHIDTAEMYGSGAVEPIVGEAIDGRRDEVFLVSKVLPFNASRSGTIEACERSLRRLRTDYLDLYLLHWRGHHPLEETFAAFDELRDAKKIRAYGVSNFDVEDLEDAWAVTAPGQIACNQVLYHLQERYIERAVIPWCQRHGIAVVGYSPFGSGEFPSPSSSGGRVLAEIAAVLGGTARQVALAFLVRQSGLFTIPKAAKRSHVADNAAAGRVTLSPEHIEQIDQAFPVRTDGSGLPII